jgi:hypothetical protein
MNSLNVRIVNLQEKKMMKFIMSRMNLERNIEKE